MNCKPGDLAVVVRSYAGQEGKIVTCIEYVGRVVFDNGASHPDCWKVDPPLYVAKDRRKAHIVADSCLRPIRGNDGEDEMLRIVGKPQPNKEIA